MNLTSTLVILGINLFLKIPHLILFLLSLWSQAVYFFMSNVARGLGKNIEYSVCSFIVTLSSLIANIVLIVGFSVGAGQGKGYNSAVECHLDVVEVISSSLIIPKPNECEFFYFDLLPRCDRSLYIVIILYFCVHTIFFWKTAKNHFSYDTIYILSL